MKKISKHFAKQSLNSWLKQGAAAACGLAMLACGADLGALPPSNASPSSPSSASPSESALTLPFPDEYFDMLLAREAAANPDGGEDCGPIMEAYTAAWGAVQSKPQFTQLTDTSAWKKAAELREPYASSGCFTSGGSLSKPSETCRPDFGKLVEAWHAVVRMPQFHVLISDAANHDVYATWMSAVTARCVLSS